MINEKYMVELVEMSIWVLDKVYESHLGYQLNELIENDHRLLQLYIVKCLWLDDVEYMSNDIVFIGEANVMGISNIGYQQKRCCQVPIGTLVAFAILIMVTKINTLL